MAIVDISTLNDTDVVNGAIITNTTLAISTGTGVFDPFLAIQASPSEEGFNTDSGLPLDDTHDSFTHSILLSTIPTVTVNGVEYLEFRVDLNESNSDPDDLIMLQQLRIFQEATGTQVEADWNGTDFGNGDPVYTLGVDQNGDPNQVLLSAEWDSGSGKGDYVFLIPKSKFDFQSPDQYVVVYMQMGSDSRQDPEASDSGFDEFGVLVAPEAPPAIDIVKTGPATIVEGGEDVIYHFTITNNSGFTDPVTVDTLTDTVYGNLLPAALAANGGNPIVLAAGQSFSFDYNPPGNLVLDAGETEHNVVTVTGHDNENTPVSDTDDHTITATNALPVIEVIKTGPATISEGGANVVYSFQIINHSGSTDPVTVTSVVDSVYGDLTAVAVAANGGNPIVLAPGGSFSFNFDPVGDLVLNAGGSLTNVVTVQGHDDENTPVSDTDDHTVLATDVPPSITIVKTGPATISEGGENVIYHFTITNHSGTTDPVTLTSLTDTVYGNLLDDAVAANGGNPIVLASGQSYSFDFDPPGDLVLNAGESETNVVTVVGTDDEGSTATASDDHVITATDVAPVIEIIKSGPATIDEGGENVVFHFRITNKSVETDPVTVTSLQDTVYGDLLDDALLANGGNPIVLAQGESFDFNFNAGNLVLNAEDSQTNVVTVIGHDDEGTEATDDDDHTVTALDVAPTITLVKTVDANEDGVFHDFEMVQAFGDSVTYKYELTNASLVPLVDPITVTNLTDDQGQFAGFDLVVNGVLQSGVTLVKSGGDQDDLLEATETWTYTKTVNVNLDPAVHLVNTATVTGHDDEGSPVSDTDTADVLAAVPGPGVRTPGFWGNLGLDFWDGDDSVPKTGPNFPGKDLLYSVDANNDEVKDGEVGLLIGDYNGDGLSAGEDTFFISLADALKVINASQKDSQDARFVLARDEVATWLNFLAGNPIGDADTDSLSPQYFLNEGIDWLQATNGGLATDTFGDWGGGQPVKTSSPTWQVAIDGNTNSAAMIHAELDTYNNTGSTFSIDPVTQVKTFHMYATDGG
jgi:hypothetical protein